MSTRPILEELGTDPSACFDHGQSRPIRAAIVGTGYIAEFHARAIRALSEVDLVAVCDANARTARSFAARWGEPNVFDTTDALLRGTPVDCVHLLVPPDLHYTLAKTVLQAGAHVFLEKPMCTSVDEADELLALACSKDLHVGVNHNLLFTNAYERLRQALQSGTLGPLDSIRLTHLSELGPIRFGPFDSWMLREPGNVILEIGPHLLSAVLDLAGKLDQVRVSADRAVDLPGGAEVYRRWCIGASTGRTAIEIIVDLGPGFSQRAIHAHGLIGSAAVDFEANTCIIDRRTPLGIDIDRYRRTISQARQLRWQARQTLLNYTFDKLKLRRGGNPYQISIDRSVAAFYRGIRSNKLDRRIDGAFGREVVEMCHNVIRGARILSESRRAPRPQRALTRQPSVLVLGGSGFIGRELIRQLLAAGYCVRAMVRESRVLLDEIDGDLEIILGDLRSEVDLNSAVDGVSFVYHLAHAAAKTWDGYLANEVEPTRLVAQACLAANVKRLIYTGTIASYFTGRKAGIITEDTPLDPLVERRSYYPRAKAASERLLMQMHKDANLPVVIFRPGIVIGKGGQPFHWGVGRFSESVCEVWGSGNHPLPFVLVGDVADALRRGIEVEGIEGKSYNLIDSPLLTACDYLNELQRQSGLRLTIMQKDIWRYYLEDMTKWVVKLAIGHPDRIRIPSYRDWDARTHEAPFDCARARQDLGWMPVSDRKRMIEEGIGGALQEWLRAAS